METTSPKEPEMKAAPRRNPRTKLFVEPNPILLFELRQAVRNRFVNGLLLLYLTAITGLFCFIAWANATAVPTLHGTLATYVSDVSTEQLLRLLFVYYAFTTATLVLYGAVRTASDRLQDSPALSTTLSPRRIVSGKMQFGFVIGLLFLSVTFPLMTGAYLMRGLDIRTLFVGAFLYFGMSQLQYFLTVAVFSTASTTGRLIAATLTTAAAQVFITFFAWLVIPELIGELSHPPHVMMLVAALLMCLFIVVTAMVFIFVFAMVGFAAESTNRMLPIRVFLTIVQAVLTAAALLVCVIEFGISLPDIVGRVVYIPNFLHWMGFPFVFALFICERETLSPRIRKTIPKKFAERLCVFPFYTGAASAVTWCVLALGCEFLFHVIANQCRSNDFWHNWGTFNFGLMFFNYCATVLLLHNLFLKRWVARQWNWTLPFAVVGLMLAFIVFASWISDWFGFYFNPEMIFDRFPLLPIPWSDQEQHLVYLQAVYSRIWFFLLVIAGTPWIYRRFKEFQPLEPGEESR